jgi:lipoprotein YgeR
LRAGSLTRNPFHIVICLAVALLLAGCAGSKSSDSGNVYTVKRGDTLYKISRQTGTSVNDLARLNGISPPYTIEVGQRLKLNGRRNRPLQKAAPKRLKLCLHRLYRSLPGRPLGSAAGAGRPLAR